MKSYYSIMLFIMFAVVMSITAVCSTVLLKKDLTPADGAIISLTIIAIMLAYRLSQAEKRIAQLENKVENSESRKNKKSQVKEVKVASEIKENEVKAESSLKEEAKKN